MQELVASVDEQWNRFTFRQKNIVGHKDTQTIPLIFDPIKKTRHIEHSNYQLFSEHLQHISDICIAAGYDGEIKRANLVKLFAGKVIKQHIDVGDFLNSLHRIHIPIFSNEQCEFHIENEMRVLPIGEIWEVNNTGKKHGVYNNGQADRVHLIVDIT